MYNGYEERILGGVRVKKGNEPKKRTITTSNIVVKRSTLANQGQTHSHDFFELSMCISGHVLHKINGKDFDFTPGDVVLLTPTDFHSETAYEPTETLQIHFRESLLDDSIVNQILDYGSEMVFRFDKKTVDSMRSIMLLLLDEYETNGDHKNEYFRRLFSCLMLLFVRAARIGSDRHTSFSPIEKALVYLHAHVRENPTLDEVAKVAGMSKTYFCTAFKERCGIGFVRYSNNLRLNYARKLLISTTLSITDICYKSGFNSESNFLRAFKQEYGMSAQKYRRTARQE